MLQKFLVEYRSTITEDWGLARQFNPRWKFHSAREAVHSLDELCVVSDLPLERFRIRRVPTRTNPRKRTC